MMDIHVAQGLMPSCDWLLHPRQSTTMFAYIKKGQPL